ncbi:hypothetical protein [uncultured Rikenella sp.]|uniref:hypothetical protein n=1 Tax=uncultured Rikenella sp. TaxID=368003 RepID=UPI00272AFF7A|nr:hypothetical protein [uncultured Rikenella sp.]
MLSGTAPGYRDAGNDGRPGGLISTWNGGYIWSSTSYDSGNHYRSWYLYFGMQSLGSNGTGYHATGLQLRCLSE